MLTSVNTLRVSAGIGMLLKTRLNFYAIRNQKLMVFCENQANNPHHKVKKTATVADQRMQTERNTVKCIFFSKMSGSCTINDSQTLELQ